VTKHVESDYSLLQTAFNRLPLRCWHNSRHEIKGEDSLDAGVVVVNSEGYALIAKRQISHAPASLEGRTTERGKLAKDRLIVWTRLIHTFKHFVEDTVQLILVEHAASNSFQFISQWLFFQAIPIIPGSAEHASVLIVVITRTSVLARV
jgi:hypothetical protein